MEPYLSLKDHVYNYLSDRIDMGQLKPGDRVSEPQVSEELNVSRTPVREALIQLASDGYLEGLPRKGFRVKALNVQKVRDLYEIIGTLDGKAAASCVELLSEEDFARMEQLILEMGKAIESGENKRYYELQTDFHDVYLSKCPNKEIPLLLAQLKKNFIRRKYFFKESGDEMKVLQNTNKQHETILKLFREKKAQELDAFICSTHWSTDKAQFDSLE